MNNVNNVPSAVSLTSLGIDHTNIHYQLSSDALHKLTLDRNMGKETSSGALAINTGEFTGRSPKDRFIVKDAITENQVWWGEINIPFEPMKFPRKLNNGRMTQRLAVPMMLLPNGTMYLTSSPYSESTS